MEMLSLSEAIRTGVEGGSPLLKIYTDTGGAVEKSDFYKEVLRLVENDDIPNVLLCYCGHDCSKCRTFRATLFDDEEMRESAAEYYKAAFGKDIPLTDIHCLSGHSDELMPGCAECPFMSCCEDKKINSCSKCTGYPCATLSWYIEKYVNKANQI